MSSHVLVRLPVLLFILGLVGCLPPPNIAPPPSRVFPEHTLLVALDGVGYDVMVEAKRRGLFPEFQRPSRVYTMFPSLSIVCFTRLLEDITAFKNPGYDVWYYDPDQKKIDGGTVGPNFEKSHAYLWLFDIARRGRTSHNLSYFFPRASYARELSTLEHEMRGPVKPQLMYVLTTDSIGHLYGKEELLRNLKRASRALARIQKRYREEVGVPLKVVLFSDHGQDWSLQWRLDDTFVRDALTAAGYHNAESLQHPKDVIVVSYGNVRSGIAYAALEDRPGIAKVISQQPGVDLTFWRTPGGAEVLNTAHGQARIDCGDDRQRYVPETGDPLQYQPLIDALEAKGELSPDGWASSAAWLEVSKVHEYPNALHRACGGFTDIVRYPADVLFSTARGAMFGPWSLEAGSNMAFGGIKGNHGGINREESSAFVATNDAANVPPEVMSYDHALRDTLFNGPPPPPPATPALIDDTKDR
jgi:hypothetical protein